MIIKTSPATHRASFEFKSAEEAEKFHQDAWKKIGRAITDPTININFLIDIKQDDKKLVIDINVHGRRKSFSINNLIRIVLSDENIKLNAEYNKILKDPEETEQSRALKDADDLVNLIIEKSKDDEVVFEVNLNRKEFCWNIYTVSFDHFEQNLYLTLNAMQEKPASLTHLNLIEATPFYKGKIEEILKTPRETFEALKKKRNDSATKIQTFFRDYCVRKEFLLVKATQKTAIERAIVEIKELALNNKLLDFYNKIEKLDKEDKFPDLNIDNLRKDLEQAKQSNDLKVVKNFLNKVINLKFNEVMSVPEMVKPIRMRMG